REQGQGIVAQLEGIDNRDQAQALIGQRILIDEDDLPELPEGEYYWQQLIGLEASNLQGEPMGRIDSILETGANDVLVLNRQVESGVEEVLIPYVPQVVKKVDLVQGTMLVDWDLSYLA
ncbi:MAG: ribosome maturation factor RimM, partial [Arenicella sp.]|nr:ribosome maturation factor RimM [Arenicella sp.]